MNPYFGVASGPTRSLRRWGIPLLLCGFLAACGGGGGTREFDADAEGDSGAPKAASVVLSVVDAGTGDIKNTISSTTQSLAKVVVTDESGAPVSNAVVSFESSDSTAVVFKPASTALTDLAGVASVTVGPAALSTAGAYTLTASTGTGDQAASASYNVAVGATQISLGTMTVEQPQLSAYGTTLVSVPIEGVPASMPVTVRFTSTCASATPARATITALANSVDGVARATYVDKGCAGADLITATVDGASVTSTASVVVQSPRLANIQFVSASPRVIALTGTGGVQGPGSGVPFPEISIVRFQLVDENGAPYPAPTDVTLRLSNNTGGILVDGVSGSVVKQTDAQGYVQVSVKSGAIPTPLWVIATAGTGTNVVTTNSVQLAVSTGQPIQSRFSMSAEHYNIEGWHYDGSSVYLTVNAADSMGNPVPDGTPVSFVSTAGLVGANCQTGVDQATRPLPGPGDTFPDAPGWCAAELRSMGTRPENGRFRVAAYAIGEEHYEDANSNNRYDVGEQFFDQGHQFLDTNENGSYEVGERIIPYLTQSGACGINPLARSVPGTCDGVRGRAHVRDQATFVFSGSFGYLRSTPSFDSPNVSNISTSYRLGAACSVAVGFWLQDLNGNPMPYGTKVSVDVAGANGLRVANPDPQLIGSTNAVGGTSHVFYLAGTVANGVCTAAGGPVFIRATTPKGNLTEFVISVAR